MNYSSFRTEAFSYIVIHLIDKAVFKGFSPARESITTEKINL